MSVIIMKISPLRVLLLYIVLIFICAVLYKCIPRVFEHPISFLDSLYFSVVTITTLGYGDLSPVSDYGKLLAAAEALLGVIFLGIFFLSVSQQLLENNERTRINSCKENLKLQYAFWRSDTVKSLLCLASSSSTLNIDLAEKLCDPNEFKKYFKENENYHWQSVRNNLASDNFYTIELVRDLETFQRHIETFIASVPIANRNILMSLTSYVNFLNKIKRLDLDRSDDTKTFLRELWSVLALWNLGTGEYGHDDLKQSIDEA